MLSAFLCWYITVLEKASSKVLPYCLACFAGMQCDVTYRPLGADDNHLFGSASQYRDGSLLELNADEQCGD